MPNIGVFVGSLSNRSYSQKIANYIMNKQLSARFIQINFEILPLYNPDLEDDTVLEWQVFRSVVDKMDALLFVTQEYNFSIPGGLKNAIDVLSAASPSIYQKPALVITDSSGVRGGANANAHIQQLLRYMGMDVMNEFLTIGKVDTLFNRSNQINDKQITEELDGVIEKFVRFSKNEQRPI